MISLHRSSSNKPLKDKEDESSPTNMNYGPDPNGMSPKRERSSLYEQASSSEDQMINAIFEENAYNHTYDSLVEFYTDVYYIMNAREVSDGRNVGTVTGVAAVGIVGCLTFGIGYIAGIAAIVVGSTVGRCCGNKIGKRKKRKRITQEDLYISKLDCMLCFVDQEKKKLKNDLNRLRLVMEKIIEEFTPTLEISLFKKQKEINLLLKKLRRVLNQKHVDEAMLLGYKLFVAAEERFDMKDRKHLQDASRRFNQVFIPFVKIVELDGKNFIKSNPNVRAYIKIKALVSNSSKVELYSQLISSRPTVETLDKLKLFLQEEVDIKAKIERAMSSVGETNPQMTESAGLRNPNAPYKFDGVNQVIKLATIKEHDGQDIEIGDNGSENIPQFDSDSIHSPNKKDFEEDDSEKKDTVLPQNRIPQTKLRPHLIIPRASEDSINSEPNGPGNMNAPGNLNAPGNGEWTISMKLHDCDLNFGEAVQREVAAQNEALMRMSTRSLQKSPGKKPARKDSEEEKYDEEDQQRASVRSGKREKTRLFEALTPRRLGKTLSSVFHRQKTRQESQASVESGEKNQENGDILNQNQNFSKADEMFQKILAIGEDYTSKWDRVSTSPVITIDKIRPEGSPVVLIRAWAVVPGFTPKEVFDQIYDTEKRAKWETVTMDLKVVEAIDETSQVIYFYVKTPIGISERDFVQMRNFKLDYPEKDTIVMSFKSVVHPKMPNVKGRIRAETHIAGYIMRPSKTQPNSTDFCIVSQSDIKGNIPKVIVNMASGKAPSEWINKLIKACEKSRKEKK